MSQVTLDTSCVVNLLSAREQSPPALLRLMRLALDSRVHLGVTDVVDDEVPQGEGEEEVQRRAYIRQELRQFPVTSISASRSAQRDALAQQFLGVLWPNVEHGSRKAQAHADKLGIAVLGPANALARLEPEPPSPPGAGAWDPVVRRAKADDRGEIKALLAPIRDSYDDFDAWLGGALTKKELWVADLDDSIGAVAVWSKKTKTTIKLATFFVGDDYRGRTLGPHLLFHQLRHWIGMKISKVFVTVSSERLDALTFGSAPSSDSANTTNYRPTKPSRPLCGPLHPAEPGLASTRASGWNSPTAIQSSPCSSPLTTGPTRPQDSPLSRTPRHSPEHTGSTMKTRTERNYPYAAAGRVWIIPTYKLKVRRDATLVVTKSELDRVNRAIGNEICGSADNLTVDELDFLCDVTATTYAELALILDMNRSSLSRWKKPGMVPSKATSNLIKRWFWMKLFGSELGDAEVPLALLDRDTLLLEYLHQRALDHGIAEPVRRRVA